MKKTFKLEDLDCANCAAKMETAIKKLPGVTNATVSFMTQKLSIEADDAVFDEVVQAGANVYAFGRYCPTSEDKAHHGTV